VLHLLANYRTFPYYHHGLRPESLILFSTSSLFIDLEVSDLPIPLTLSFAILKKVVEYCNYHSKNPKDEITFQKFKTRGDGLSEWDLNFLNVDQATLFQLINAANFLDIKPLLDATSYKVCSMIRGKTPEEIRRTFNIRNDFTPEEEEAALMKMEWCEQT
jgi:S-phase kinase-associated protein 1